MKNCDGIVEVSTSTSYLEKEKQYLYPVPADDYLSIYDHLGEVDRLQLFSTTGKLVLDKRLDKTVKIDHIETGVYFVIFYSKTKEIIGQQKLVICR